MAKQRDIGVFDKGEFWTVVYPSTGTIDGCRSMSIPAEAFSVLAEHFRFGVAGGVDGEPSSREEAVLASLREREGVRSLGSLITDALKRVGENPQDRENRRQLCGMINSMAEDGVLVREDDGKVEKIKLPGV